MSSFTPFDPFEHFESFTLKNGIRVYAGHLPTANQQVFSAIIGAGHYHGPAGLAHFTEHIVAHAKGSGEATSWRKEMEKLGGSCDGGSTSLTVTRYGFMLPMLHAELFTHYLNRLKKYIFDCSFEYDDKIEKGIFLSEYSKDQPPPSWAKIVELAHLTNNPKHYFRVEYTPFGDEKIIQDRTTEEVRAFYRQHYTPANTHIITAGRLTREEVEALFKSSDWESLPAHGTPTALPPAYAVEPPLLVSHAYYVANEKFASFQLTRYYPSSYKLPALWLTRGVLSVMSNDLLREELGLSYGITTRQGDYKDCTTLRLSNNGIAKSDIPQIHDAILKLFERIAGPTFAEEVAKEKLAILASYGSREYDTRTTTHEAFYRLDDLGRIYSHAEFEKMIGEITVEEVREILLQLSPLQGAFYRWSLPSNWEAPAGIPVLNVEETLEKFLPPGTYKAPTVKMAPQSLMDAAKLATKPQA